MPLSCSFFALPFYCHDKLWHKVASGIQLPTLMQPCPPGDTARSRTPSAPGLHGRLRSGPRRRAPGDGVQTPVTGFGVWRWSCICGLNCSRPPGPGRLPWRAFCAASILAIWLADASRMWFVCARSSIDERPYGARERSMCCSLIHYTFFQLVYYMCFSFSFKCYWVLCNVLVLHLSLVKLFWS